MSLENLSQDQQNLKDQLINNHNKIKLLLIIQPDGSPQAISEPQVQYFNPEDCVFRIRLANHHVADVPLQDIREVHLCG